MRIETIRLRMTTGSGNEMVCDHPAVRAALVGKSRREEKQEFCFDSLDLGLWRQGVQLVVERQGVRWLGQLIGLVGRSEVRQEWDCGTGEQPDWSELKRLLAACSIEEIKSKALRPCLLVHRKEEWWRLEYPDGSRLWLCEARGQLEWLGEEGVTEPFHELVVQHVAGSRLRFLQTVLALGRQGGACLEPLSPAARGLARLDPGPVTAMALERVVWEDGERAIGGLAKAGAGRIAGMLDQLAALLYGPEQACLEAVCNLERAVSGLRRLIGWFAEWMPERMHRDMDNELIWLAGEIRPACVGVDLRQVTLPGMRRHFPEVVHLAEAEERARQEGGASVQRAREAVDSFRFARLWIGLATWLSSEEGVKAALRDSEAGVRVRQQATVDEQAQTLLRPLIKPLKSAWAGWGRNVPVTLEELRELLVWAEALEDALGLCGGCCEERRASGWHEGVTVVAGAARAVVALEEERQLWQRLAADWSGQPVAALFRGWQGARLEGAWQDWERAWASFSCHLA
ncbi:MAG: hypothetical protein G8237_02445 [Magnetococcales bacterium]|nr:hypothetical protein [Magnetococcales bacterium]